MAQYTERVIIKDSIEDGNSEIDFDDKESTEQENDLKYGYIDVLICAVITVCVFLYCYFFFYAFYSYRSTALNYDIKTNMNNSLKNVDTFIEFIPLENNEFIRRNSSLKFILKWLHPDSELSSMSSNIVSGQSEFISRKCAYTNCFITSNMSYFYDNREFDMILFLGIDISYNEVIKPSVRSPHQKYVFVSNASPEDYPICTDEYDGFFNWTLTYKLNSDIPWGYLVIRDMNNRIIGPKKNMTWLKSSEMSPLSEEFKTKLMKKSIAVAWLVHSCHDKYNRNYIVKELQNELSKYKCENYTCRLDIYGHCGKLQCSNDDERCDSIIKEKYFFYMSFENSFADDFVTDELFKALDNNAVPIVYGGANYSRFLPDGSYLDASKLNPGQLAAKIHELMYNHEKYFEYFKWKNHYIYQQTSQAIENEYCKLCSLLNDERYVMKTSIYHNFSQWWSPKRYCVDVNNSLIQI